MYRKTYLGTVSAPIFIVFIVFIVKSIMSAVIVNTLSYSYESLFKAMLSDNSVLGYTSTKLWARAWKTTRISKYLGLCALIEDEIVEGID